MIVKTRHRCNSNRIKLTFKVMILWVFNNEDVPVCPITTGKENQCVMEYEWINATLTYMTLLSLIFCCIANAQNCTLTMCLCRLLKFPFTKA